MKIKFIALFFVFLLMLSQGCSKDFLESKPNSSIVIPSTLEDLQQLLDNSNVMNYTGALSQLSADEYFYLSEELWAAASTAIERNAYVWAPDIYEGEANIRDWNYPYMSCFYANNVLDQLGNIKPTIEKDIILHQEVKGWALFVRAYAFFDLMKNFTLPYDEATASTDLGIPLRLMPEIDVIQQRSTVKVCYERIIQDLEEAVELLPSNFDLVKRNRPSRVAAYAFLSRIYLYMRNYVDAEKYANKCLELYSTLIDYNTLDVNKDNPFIQNNEEVLFSTTQITGLLATAPASYNSAVAINNLLIQMHEPDDLRLFVFYGKRGEDNYFKKACYNDSGYPFSGLATDEVYLNKAECLARRNKAEMSMDVLNQLLIKRFATGKFVSKAAQSDEEALNIILDERKKELVWRGLRWMDLKRLNKEGANITLKRTLGNKEYTLKPNDNCWIFPIPDDEVNRSRIKQNIRFINN